MPQLSLGARYDIMGFGQFLNIVRAGTHRILEDLHRTDLSHMQDDLGVLRIVLVPAVVQRLACPSQGNGGHQLEIKPSDTRMIPQHAVIGAAKPMVWPSNPIRTGGP